MADDVGDEEPEESHVGLVSAEVPDKGGDDQAEINRAGHRRELSETNTNSD